MVDVTQEDRQAMVDYHALSPIPLHPSFAQDILDGQHDDMPRLQLFARHRLARPAPDGGAVAWMYERPNATYPELTGRTVLTTERWADDDLCDGVTGLKVWTETPLYAHPPRNDAVVEALRAKVAQLQEALVQHNERLRSAASIARRDGRETNWLTFRGAVTYTLAEYRELVTECVDALKQGEA